jgi:hypothetical protein
MSLGDNKTKIKTNQSQFGEKTIKAPDVDSVAIPANTKGADDPRMDDAAVGLITASGDKKCKKIPAASAETLYLTIEAAATNINSASRLATAMEVLPRPAGTSAQINPEASPGILTASRMHIQCQLMILRARSQQWGSYPNQHQAQIQGRHQLITLQARSHHPNQARR